MRKFALAVFIPTFLLFNVLAMPEGAFIAPSRFFLSSDFSYRLALYEKRPTVDYLVMGNSRARVGLNPSVLADELSRLQSRQVSVVSLATGGGYFPFYLDVVRDLIAEHLPRKIVLGVSPRDFNNKELRRFKVYSLYRKSSGYDLRQIPYAEPGRTIEQRLADLTAAIFPALYYRQHILGLLVPAPVIDYAKPRLGETPGWFRKYLWEQISFANNERLVIPSDLEGWRNAFARYLHRFVTVFAWSPEDQKEVDANGYPLAAPMNDEVRADLAERQLAAWKKIRNDGTFSEYRTSPLCQREVELDERHDSEFIQFLDFATGKNVEVQLVFLPAIWLESCENNLAFNRQIMDYVNSVAARYDGRVRVIDMNNGFDHAFLDVRHYSDLEHFTPESAIALSREAARLIGTK